MIVWPDQERGCTRCRIASAAILAVVWAGIPLLAAPQQAAADLRSDLLVIPAKPPPADAGLPNLSDLRAAVGQRPYQVRSVMRASNWKGLKIEIVFDLASTAAEDRPCMLEQARAVWREWRGMPGLEILMAFDSWSGEHGNLGQFGDRVYQYFAPGALPEKTCTPFTRAQRDWGHRRQPWEDSSVEAFRGLASGLEKGRGPVVVIWVGQTFSWFHAGGWPVISVDTGGFVTDHTRTSENAACPWLDRLTEAGVDVFPMVWLNGRLQNEPGPQESVRDAAEIASSLGGQVSVSEVDVAPRVTEILERCNRGWVVEVVGPAVGWKSDGAAEILRLWLEGDRAALDSKRHFVRLERPRHTWTLRSGFQSVEPIVPLFDTEWLKGRAGCSSNPAAAATRWTMTALAPESIGKRANGLPTLVEFFPRREDAATRQAADGPFPEEAYLNFKSRKPTLAAAGGPKGFTEVCVSLPPTTASDGNYRVVVFDPETKWSAVGILPLSEVLRYQQQHGLRAGGERPATAE